MFSGVLRQQMLLTDSGVLRQPAPADIPKVPCADHSDEPLNAEMRRQWATHFPEFHLHCTKSLSYLPGAGCHIRCESESGIKNC